MPSGSGHRGSQFIVQLYIPESERSTSAMDGRVRGSRATHLSANASMATATSNGYCLCSRPSMIAVTLSSGSSLAPSPSPRRPSRSASSRRSHGHRSPGYQVLIQFCRRISGSANTKSRNVCPSLSRYGRPERQKSHNQNQKAYNNQKLYAW